MRNLGNPLSHKVSPRDTALIDLRNPETAREYTYNDVNILSNAVARGLLRRGLKRGDSVAIVSANRAEFLLTMLGAMRAGLVAVPLNYKMPRSTIEFQLRDSCAKTIFCDAERIPLIPQGLQIVGFDDSGENGFEAFLDRGQFEPISPTSTEVAMLIYTSGSTGRPKGVLFSHHGHLWANDVRSRGEPLRNDRALIAAPLYHMNALSWSQTLLANGGVIVLMPVFDARAYIRAVEAFKVTILPAIPTLIALVLKEREWLLGTDVSTVRLVRLSSAPLTQSLLARAREAFPGALIANGYGSTEGGPYMFGPHPMKLPVPELSVGYPDADVQARLVVEGKTVEDEGVLELKSPATMLGYHNLPAQTRAAMTADGYYTTGDVFRRDGKGFFHFVRRADDMFVCGGENIFPSEVEQMLATHPGVHQVCVVPIADEVKGHKPVAFVVPKADEALTEQAIKDYALARAPAYQHPRRVWIVSELPLAGTSKVDRRKLTELAAALI